MHLSFPSFFLLAGLAAMGASCGGDAEETKSEPSPLDTADAERGGALYDNWWEVARIGRPWAIPEPIGNHPLWDDRPDLESNARGGSVTWRCTECHGWDYRGVDGKFGTGGHRTGFKGIYGTTLTADEIFELLRTGEHSFVSLGLSDQDRWDLTRFVLEGAWNVDDFIDGAAQFKGDAEKGPKVYDTPNLKAKDDDEAKCGDCHGDDGVEIPPLADQYYVGFLGKVSTANPWEALHKIRFGEPAVKMHGLYAQATDDDFRDLGAYLQTMPVAPPPKGE